MGNFASGLSLKLLYGFVGVFLISACSGSQIPETPQAQAESPTQVLQITPTLALPPEADLAILTASEAGDMISQSQDGYPYPAPEEGYPSSEDQSLETLPLTEGYPSPDDSFVATVPVLKTELEATDPSTVNLASGEIQLIEFFAFW